MRFLFTEICSKKMPVLPTSSVMGKHGSATSLDEYLKPPKSYIEPYGIFYIKHYIYFETTKTSDNCVSMQDKE